MNRIQFLSGLMCGIGLTIAGTQLLVPGMAAVPAADEPPLYELRIYTAPEGKLDALNARFREHTLGLFEKHGMKNVMYWVATDKPNTLIYVIAHRSRQAADDSWAAFRNDPVWKKVAEETQRDGKIVDKVDSWYMQTTDYSPAK